ncbi:hypothetical protein SNEBB_002949 [Seison nebaliae]|nr:hypothetical protein SNEBB_002949 [Seison nebaliae]
MQQINNYPTSQAQLVVAPSTYNGQSEQYFGNEYSPNVPSVQTIPSNNNNNYNNNNIYDNHHNYQRQNNPIKMNQASKSTHNLIGQQQQQQFNNNNQQNEQISPNSANVIPYYQPNAQFNSYSSSQQPMKSKLQYTEQTYTQPVNNYQQQHPSQNNYQISTSQNLNYQSSNQYQQQQSNEQNNYYQQPQESQFQQQQQHSENQFQLPQIQQSQFQQQQQSFQQQQQQQQSVQQRDQSVEHFAKNKIRDGNEQNQQNVPHSGNRTIIDQSDGGELIVNDTDFNDQDIEQILQNMNLATSISANNYTNDNSNGSVSEKAVLISNIPRTITPDKIVTFFSDRNKTGGGPIDYWDVPEYGKLKLFFSSINDARRVCLRNEIDFHKMKLNIQRLSNKLEEFDPQRIILLNIPPKTSKEVIELYVERIIDEHLEIEKTQWSNEHPSTVMITFNDVIDFHDIKKKQELRPTLSGSSIQLRQTPFPTTLFVENIPSDISGDVLELYFSNHKRSGVPSCSSGKNISPVIGVLLDDESHQAYVTFRETRAVTAVLTRKHVLRDQELNVSKYHELMGKEQFPETSIKQVHPTPDGLKRLLDERIRLLKKEGNSSTSFHSSTSKLEDNNFTQKFDNHSNNNNHRHHHQEKNKSHNNNANKESISLIEAAENFSFPSEVPVSTQLKERAPSLISHTKKRSTKGKVVRRDKRASNNRMQKKYAQLNRNNNNNNKKQKNQNQSIVANMQNLATNLNGMSLNGNGYHQQAPPPQQMYQQPQQPPPQDQYQHVDYGNGAYALAEAKMDGLQDAQLVLIEQSHRLLKDLKKKFPNLRLTTDPDKGELTLAVVTNPKKNTQITSENAAEIVQQAGQELRAFFREVSSVQWPISPPMRYFVQENMDSVSDYLKMQKLEAVVDTVTVTMNGSPVPPDAPPNPSAIEVPVMYGVNDRKANKAVSRMNKIFVEQKIPVGGGTAGIMQQNNGEDWHYFTSTACGIPASRALIMDGGKEFIIAGFLNEVNTLSQRLQNYLQQRSHLLQPQQQQQQQQYQQGPPPPQQQYQQAAPPPQQQQQFQQAAPPQQQQFQQQQQFVQQPNQFR